MFKPWYSLWLHQSLETIKLQWGFVSGGFNHHTNPPSLHPREKLMVGSKASRVQTHIGKGIVWIFVCVFASSFFWGGGEGLGQKQPYAIKLRLPCHPHNFHNLLRLKNTVCTQCNYMQCTQPASLYKSVQHRYCISANIACTFSM